jgi:hypothetical protein
MKRGKLIVIYRLSVTGQSGMDGSNRASPRGAGAGTGMGRQWLAQPLWANIANLDPALANGRLLTLFEGAAQALLVEGDVAAAGLACAEQRLEKTHERFTVRWNVGAILPADGDRLMTWGARPGRVTIAPGAGAAGSVRTCVSPLVPCPRAPLYSRLVHCHVAGEMHMLHRLLFAMIAVTSLTLVGCANSPQQLSPQPRLTSQFAAVGQGQAVAVRVVDGRPSPWARAVACTRKPAR